MQTGYYTLSAEWVSFEQLTGSAPISGTKYQLQNRGVGTIILLESASAPDADVVDGNVLTPKHTAIYESGSQTLYIKATTPSSINISELS